MARQWFGKIGPDEFGPWTTPELKAAALSGRLRPQDLVRTGGMATGVGAGTVKGLTFGPSPPARRGGPPPLPNRDKPGPPPLPSPAGGRPPTLPVARPSFPLREVRHRLTAYARAVPHHDTQDLGAEAEVVGSAVLTVHRVEWTTLFERRELVGRERPHDGGAVTDVATVTAANYDPWTESLPPSDVAGGIREISVSGSESSRGCDCCAAEGQVCCPSCDGEAAVTCSGCDGDGSVRCSACLGLRRVEHKVPQQGRRACHCVSGGYSPDPNVNGGCHRCRNTGVEQYTHYASEWVQCVACQATGRRRCGGCRGDGQVTCPKCDAEGVVSCDPCAGSGNVVHSLAVVQTLEPHGQEVIAPPADCPAGAVDSLVVPDDFVPQATRSAVGSAVTLDDVAVPDHVKAGAADVRTQAASLVDANRRHAGERVGLSRAVVYRLDYTVRGGRYTAWLPAADRPVYAPRSPLTERAARLVSDALSDWAGGDKRAATRSLRMAFDMGKKCPHCRAKIDEFEATLPADLSDEAEKFSLSHWFGNLFR